MSSNVGGPDNVEVVNEAGWRVIVSSNVAKSATMRTENGVKSWLLPIDTSRETKWELRYGW
jgi:hypothetical protein